LLQWTLAGTVMLSLAALWWPEPAVTMARVDPSAAPLELRPHVASPSSPGRLPAELPRQSFELAEFDPFTGMPPPAPPAPMPVEIVKAAEAPPPPLPPPPPVPYRYLGRMTDPGGTQRTFVGNDTTMIPIERGTVLDGGYVVDAIGADAIRLRYPPTGTQVDIAVPPPEEEARR